jgi:hypothetical protein
MGINYGCEDIRRVGELLFEPPLTSQSAAELLDFGSFEALAARSPHFSGRKSFNDDDNVDGPLAPVVVVDDGCCGGDWTVSVVRVLPAA